MLYAAEAAKGGGFKVTQCDITDNIRNVFWDSYLLCFGGSLGWVVNQQGPVHSRPPGFESHLHTALSGYRGDDPAGSAAHPPCILSTQ